MAKCDDALSAYNLLILDAMDVGIEKDCADRRDLFMVFKVLFMAWAAVSGQAALCLILHFGAPWCIWLFVLALFGMIMLILLALWIAGLTMRMRRNRKKCLELNQKLKDAYDKVKQDCPENRWPKELAQFKCDCG